MRETNDIERLFQESFDGFEATPPVSVKTAIDKELESKKRLVWWLSTLVIVLATIASSFIILSETGNGKSVHSQRRLAKNSVNGSTPSSSEVNHSHLSVTKEIKNNSSNNAVNSSESANIHYEKSVDEPKTVSTTTSSLNLKSLKPNNSYSAKTKKATQKKLQKTKNNGLTTEIPETKEWSGTKPDPIVNTDPIKTGIKDGSSNEVADTPKTGTEKQVDSISTAKVDSTTVQDSTSIAENHSSDPGKTNEQDHPKKWLASYYFGPQFDLWKVNQPNFDLTVNPSFRTSLEISRQLKSNFSVSAGLGYNSFKEIGSTTFVSSIDTTQSIDSIPIYDQQFPDSIIGYQTVLTNHYDTIKGHSTYSNSTTVFYIPFSVSKTFELSDKWLIMTDLGATFNFYSTKQSTPDPNSPVKSYNSFGINAALRLYGGYRFSTNWMVTAGFTYSIYLKTPVVYNGLNSQRMFISPQLGIHYSF